MFTQWNISTTSVESSYYNFYKDYSVGLEGWGLLLCSSLCVYGWEYSSCYWLPHFVRHDWLTTVKHHWLVELLHHYGNKKHESYGFPAIQ